MSCSLQRSIIGLTLVKSAQLRVVDTAMLELG